MYRNTVGLRALPGIGRQAVALLPPLLSLLLLLAALSPQRAAAQTFISNMSNAHASDPVPIRKNRIQSQSFQTGGVTDGYTLHSVALRFRSLGAGGGGGRLTVTLRANGPDDRPGPLLHTLRNPFPWRFDGVNLFTTLTDVALAADTWYHVVAEYSKSSSGPWWARARSGSDPGAVDGWRIRSSRYESSDGESWDARSVLTMAVRGLPRTEVTAASEGDVTEGEPAVFTLARTGTSAETLDVTYETTARGDFGVAPGAGTATFPAGDATVRVSVPTTDDGTHEPHGSVTLALTLTVDTAAASAYLPGDPAVATAAVRDDDDSPATGTVTITGTAREGETLAANTSALADADGLTRPGWTYRWVRTPPGGAGADVPGATGATYVPVLADAGATLEVRVTATDDEGHEATFTSAPTAPVEAAPRPSVTVVSDGGVTEGAPVTFTLARTGDAAGALAATYAVTATAGFGVAPGAGTAAFPAGDASVQVQVPTTGDGTHEPHGSVTLALTPDAGPDPAYRLGDPSQATAAVRDDDNAAPTGAVTIDDTTPSAGRTLAADASGLDDPDGLTARSFTWRWLRVSEGAETEIAGAASASYAVSGTDVGATLKARVVFTDDDGTVETVESAETAPVGPPLPAVTAASGGDATEGDPVTFTLARTGGAAGTLDVAYEVTAAGDFGVTTGAGTATFPAGDATVQVPVPTTGDSAHEPHGSATLALTPDAGPDPAYLLGAPSAAAAAVRDDDDSPATGSVAITGTPAEGETLAADTSGLADADGLDGAAYAYRWVRTPPGGAGADVPGATGATYVPVLADAGATLEVRVTVTDDEGHEATFTSAPTPAVTALPRPSVTVGSRADTVKEGEDAVFLLTRTGPATDALAVTFSVTGGETVLSGEPPTEAAFGAGASKASVSLGTVNDDTHEADAPVTLALADGDAYDPGTPAAATVTVRDDDDPPPQLSVDDASVPEGGSGESAKMRFTVTLDSAPASEVTVDWATADGTAQAGADYAPGSGRLTFKAGKTSKTVTVSVTGDDTDEPNETFTVTLSNASGASLGRATGAGTITDDDDAPEVTLVLTPASITEAAGRSTVTATLDRASSEETTVTVSAAPEPPAAAGDYALSAGPTLAIPAGATASTGRGDDHRDGQRLRRAPQDGDGVGDGDERPGSHPTAGRDADDPGRRERGADGRAGDRRHDAGGRRDAGGGPVGHRRLGRPDRRGLHLAVGPDGAERRRDGGRSRDDVRGGRRGRRVDAEGEGELHRRRRGPGNGRERADGGRRGAAGAVGVGGAGVEPGGGRRGRAVHGDAHGGDDGSADGPLPRGRDRRHGEAGRGRREDPRLLGRRDQHDGRGTDGARRRPRAGQHGDGDAGGGRGLRPGRRHGGGAGRRRRRRAGDGYGDGRGHGDGRRDAGSGHVGPRRRRRSGRRDLGLPVGADAGRRQRRGRLRRDLADLCADLRGRGRDAQGPGDGHRRRGPRGDLHERPDPGGGGAASTGGHGGLGRRRNGGQPRPVHSDAHGRHGADAGRDLRGDGHRGLRRRAGRGHGDVPGGQRHGAGEHSHDGRRRPRGARLGNGDVDGGHGRRPRLPARRPVGGDGGGGRRRRRAGNGRGDGDGHGEGRRDAGGGRVGPRRRGRTGQRGLGPPVGTNPAGRRRRGHSRCDLEDLRAGLRGRGRDAQGQGDGHRRRGTRGGLRERPDPGGGGGAAAFGDGGLGR